eukprot:UN10383
MNRPSDSQSKFRNEKKHFVQMSNNSVSCTHANIIQYFRRNFNFRRSK